MRITSVRSLPVCTNLFFGTAQKHDITDIKKTKDLHGQDVDKTIYKISDNKANVPAKLSEIEIAGNITWLGARVRTLIGCSTHQPMKTLPVASRRVHSVQSQRAGSCLSLAPDKTSDKND